MMKRITLSILVTIMLVVSVVHVSVTHAIVHRSAQVAMDGGGGGDSIANSNDDDSGDADSVSGHKDPVLNLTGGDGSISASSLQRTMILIRSWLWFSLIIR